MNAPLSRYLTSFAAAPPPEPVVIEVTALAPEQALGWVESDADIAMREALADAEACRDSELATLKNAHALELADAVVAARKDWTRDQGLVLAVQIDEALRGLKDTLSDRIADVLRPMLAETIVSRTVDALAETIDRIVADASHPCLTLRGPADLLDAIRAQRSTLDGITFEPADRTDVVLRADGLKIETRLGRALAMISDTES